MHKFSCKNCGACCKDFGSFGTLPIFSDEKERYKRVAEEKRIKLEFTPENIWLDKISGSLICLNWGMKGNPCKFLGENNLCGIYQERSLICKAFPIEKFPEKDECVKLGCFMDCAKCDLGEIVHEASLVKESNLNWFKETFGQESFDARVEIERRKKFLGNSLERLEKEKKVDLVETEFLNYKGLEVLDVFEFLKKFKIVYT